MKKLLIVALLCGAGWLTYRWLDQYSGGVVKAANPAEQLREGKKAEEIVQEKANKEKVDEIQRAVNGFHDTEGRWPSSLQELVDKKLIDAVPPGVVYDPATGRVSAG